jgi:hypothetical protein
MERMVFFENFRRVLADGLLQTECKERLQFAKVGLLFKNCRNSFCGSTFEKKVFFSESHSGKSCSRARRYKALFPGPILQSWSQFYKAGANSTKLEPILHLTLFL